MVMTNAKTVDDVDYGATTTKVSFEVQKALLTVTAKNVTVKVDEELPPTYDLV